MLHLECIPNSKCVSFLRLARVDCNKRAKMNLLNIIENIQDETPFTASGFFNVDRSTLTAIAGATLTYLIILLQMDDGKEK